MKFHCRPPFDDAGRLRHPPELLRWVFPQYKTFMNIMLVFPISLATTALLMLAAVLYFRPSRRYAHLQKSDGAASAKIEG